MCQGCQHVSLMSTSVTFAQLSLAHLSLHLSLQRLLTFRCQAALCNVRGNMEGEMKMKRCETIEELETRCRVKGYGRQ